MSGCRDIWLVRHGRTPSNAARIIQGQIDAPLDELGVAQAEALGRWFSAEGVTFGAAFSSPLQRAARTAAAPEIDQDPSVTQRRRLHADERRGDNVLYPTDDYTDGMQPRR